MEKVYLASINNELLFDDLKECVQFIVDNSENPLTKTIKVFVKNKPKHKDLLDVDCIAETLECRGYDIGQDYAEDYMYQFWSDPDKRAELSRIVLKWFNDNIDQPTFYTTGKELEVLDVTESLCKSFNIDLGLGLETDS